jgi:hypothetical protein
MTVVIAFLICCSAAIFLARVFDAYRTGIRRKPLPVSATAGPHSVVVNDSRKCCLSLVRVATPTDTID